MGNSSSARQQHPLSPTTTLPPPPPQPFVDILPLSRENPVKSGTVSDVWSSILQKYIKKPLSNVSEKVSEGLRHLVINTVRQFLDVVEGKIFMDGYEWENSVPLMVRADILLHKVISVASRLCTRFAATVLESRVVSGLTDNAAYMTAKVSSEIAARAFSIFLEEAIVETVVSASIRLAVQAFVSLAELAASVLTAVGVVLVVLTVLGLILDLSLGLQWYDGVIKPEDLRKQVENFQRVFADAGNADMGVAQPVTLEEIVAIDLYIQTNEDRDEEDPEYDNDKFLRRYFHSTNLLGNKSKMVFVQEAAQEYLSGRTMNTLGQRIIHA